MRYVIYKEVPLQKQNLRAMIKDTTKYEEWLTTIANTRLIYNTMDELEKTLDNYSIHSNGIKRCFKKKKKMRSAYRDLKAISGASISDDGLSLIVDNLQEDINNLQMLVGDRSVSSQISDAIADISLDIDENELQDILSSVLK